ncbi:DUF937 domain-containing protein [Kovacikia minuta CCNUW1]|uniref:DUF937 domain-containing protein n=1 Tax=Kovacikia minuta TaxID=2931930 RepID=UPI001CCBC550|nr:DUF937 domain-containing protein [Kovacikia minuta]UBF28407.1 DUF937 domain-containing protein [Kovacikia minuta CCNUW1]
MALFDEILSAVANPEMQANPDQLSGILSTVQQLSNNYGTDPGTTQTLVSVVGNYLRSSLQAAGPNQAQSLVNQFGGTTPNQQAVEALLGAGMQQQLVQDLIQKTGLDPQTIQSMLPMLIPLALNLLQSGNNTQNPQAGNPILNSFLDGDNDGDVDLGDVMNVAGRFLGGR